MLARTLLVALAAIPGAVIGSFLGTVVERLPRGLSPLRGRSACDHCGRPLDPAELVPVVSWIVQHGRCRSCGGSIGSWQLLAEIASMIIAMVAVGLWNGASALLVAVFGWQLLVLALLDARFLWLPRGLMIFLGMTGGGCCSGRDCTGSVSSLGAWRRGARIWPAMVRGAGLSHCAGAGRHGWRGPTASGRDRPLGRRRGRGFDSARGECHRVGGGSCHTCRRA